MEAGAVLPPVLCLLSAPFVGSFLGLLVLRLPADLPVVAGRSRCDRCAASLGVLDLVPLLSWLALRGRCRRCGARIDDIHPVCEAAALGLAAWTVLVMPPSLQLPTAALGWSLLAIAAIDLRHYVIPDLLAATVGGIGLLAIGVPNPSALIEHGLSALLAYALFRGIAALYARRRGRQGLGEGDARLLAALAVWVSWEGLPSVLLWASLGGLAHALWLAVRGRRITAATRLPFGPHLCLGGWLVWLYGPLVLG
jgi:leader peptidase (prepilin peptidase)/N-methyltransferase